MKKLSSQSTNRTINKRTNQLPKSQQSIIQLTTRNSDQQTNICGETKRPLNSQNNQHTNQSNTSQQSTNKLMTLCSNQQTNPTDRA